MTKMIKDTIHANGIDIGIYTTDFENEFISLTDIARYKSDEPKDVVKNWMRSKDTIEFLGLWEQLHNSSFKGVEFDAFRNQAGSNAFTMSPSKWIDATLYQLLVLANMESYNAILIKQEKSQAERMQLLHELAVQQMTTLSSLELSNLPDIAHK